MDEEGCALHASKEVSACDGEPEERGPEKGHFMLPVHVQLLCRPTLQSTSVHVQLLCRPTLQSTPPPGDPGGHGSTNEDRDWAQEASRTRMTEDLGPWGWRGAVGGDSDSELQWEETRSEPQPTPRKLGSSCTWSEGPVIGSLADDPMQDHTATVKLRTFVMGVTGCGN